MPSPEIGPVTVATVPPPPPHGHTSWVDRSQVMAGRAPGGPWSVYLVLVPAIALALATIGLLADDPASLDRQRLAYGAYPAFTLALMDWLDRVAARALQAFRPALPDDPALVHRHLAALTSLPARPTAAVTLGFAAVSVVGMALDPVGRGLSGLAPGVVAARAVVDAIGIAILGVLVYHTIHQLRAVVRVQADATRTDLFRPGPLYAYSGLTAQTGIGLLAIPAYGLLTDVGGWSSVESVLFISAVMVAAVGSFTLPLMGINRRIRSSRDALAADVGDRLHRAMLELHGRLDARDDAGVVAADHAVAALTREWDLVERLPTWPWRATTLRAFVSALLVPLVLWLATHALERFVPS